MSINIKKRKPATLSIDVSRWMEVYDELIKARKGDFMSVGVLEVTD